MDWLLFLALATFAALIAFLAWNHFSTKRRHETGGNTAGLGGPNDPLSGAGNEVRKGPELRASLDAANKR